MIDGAGARYRDPKASVAERVADLLGRMTLEEKVAQLGAVWITQLVRDDRFDDDAATSLLPDGIGQITRIGASTGLRPQESAALLNRVQERVLRTTRLAIPVVLHEESTGGFTHRDATVFPQALGLAATWDPALVEAVAGVIRVQMRATGARMALAPVLDVARDPRWGRVEETYGESPELCAQVGVAYVRGLQTEDLAEGVACAAKHFLAYAASIGGRNQGPVHIGPRELRDVYAAPFAAAIRDAGLASIMNSYSSVDGLPCAGSKAILTTLLRDELRFDGVVVADYFAVYQLMHDHRTAATEADAAAQALSAGLDVELPALHCYRELPGLVRSGRLAERVVDQAVERVLAQKFRLGLFEKPYVEGDPIEHFDTPGQRALARRAATRSLCLLTNRGALPIDPASIASVAVIGPHADDARLLQGDYHYPAHLEIIYKHAAARPAGSGEPAAAPDVDGLPADRGSFRPGPHFTPHITPLAGLRAALEPGVRVEHVRGCHDSDPLDHDIAAAAAAAERADVAIVFVGAKSGLVTDCTVGEMRDATSLDLPGAQLDLVRAVCGTGTPTVVVVISGRVHTLGEVCELAGAVAWTPPPGEEGGRAITDVLTGAVDASGRLPVTLPRHVGQVPLHHDMRARGDRSEIYGDYVDAPVAPLFPFGHGLSYTTFAYDGLTVDAGSTTTPTTVRVTVTNTGAREGDEVVQLYVRDDVASVARPARELVGFARVTLDAAASTEVTFTVDPSRLAFFDAGLERVVEPGTFTFMVGASAGDIRAERTVGLGGARSHYALADVVRTRASGG